MGAPSAATADRSSGAERPILRHRPVQQRPRWHHGKGWLGARVCDQHLEWESARRPCARHFLIEERLFGFVFAGVRLGAWFATAREATTPLPKVTGWACLDRMTSGSWTARFATTLLASTSTIRLTILFRGNLFSRRLRFGILVEGDRNQARRNRCVRNAACILIGFRRRDHVIARNHHRRRCWVSIENGRDDLVAGNVISGAQKRASISA